MNASARHGQSQGRATGVRGDDRGASLARFAKRVEAELRDLRRADRIRRAVKGRRY
jgi:hypothetical protein